MKKSRAEKAGEQLGLAIIEMVNQKNTAKNYINGVIKGLIGADNFNCRLCDDSYFCNLDKKWIPGTSCHAFCNQCIRNPDHEDHYRKANK